MIISKIAKASITVIFVAMLQNAQASLVDAKFNEWDDVKINGIEKPASMLLDLQGAKFFNKNEHRQGKMFNAKVYDEEPVTKHENSLSHNRHSDWCLAGAACENWRRIARNIFNQHEQWPARPEQRGNRHSRRYEDEFRHHAGEYYNTNTYVPIPAVIWLFGSGLLLLSGVALRRGTDRDRSMDLAA